MALTGIILFLFVVGHMLGNLQIYLGAEQINPYAELLHARPGLLWAARLVLLFCVDGAHRGGGPALAAEPGEPAGQVPGLPAAGGGLRGPDDGVERADHRPVHRLPRPAPHHRPGPPRASSSSTSTTTSRRLLVSWVAAIYIVANLLLAFHLYHGLWSLFQTLGWDHPRWGEWRRGLAMPIAVVIGAGNVSIPLAVLAGVVHRREVATMKLDARIPSGPLADKWTSPAKPHQAGAPGQQAKARRSSWSAPASPAARPPRRSASSATR